MHSFSLDRSQLMRIIAALIAEELSWSADRKVDFLTAASWEGTTDFGPGGLNLSAEQRKTSSKRIESFFGCEDGLCEPKAGTTLGGWAEMIEGAIAEKFDIITFTPAGGQGSEYGCVHRADAIFADAAGMANLLHGRRRLLSFVAPHSLMGFILTVLTPNLLAVPVLDARAMAPDILQSTLEFGDALVATPTLWRYILQQKIVAPDNTMGVFFGEPMTAELSADMRQAGFGAQRELYGSTEHGLIGWRDSPTEDFVLFDHWGRDGEKLQRLDRFSAPAPVMPMDNLSWSGDRRFALSGRRDGAMQIGAVNVFPDKIAGTLKSHEFVEECLMRVGKHKDGVNRLIAYIKLADKTSPTELVVRAIDRFCRANLRPQERPSIFHFVIDLSMYKE